MTTELTVINARPRFVASAANRATLRPVDARPRFTISVNGQTVLVPSAPTARSLRVTSPVRVSFAPQGGTRVLVARPGRGPQGEPGAPGDVQSVECGEAISALRVIAIINGEGFLANHDDTAHAGRVAGLTLTAANQGATTSVRMFGRVTDASWNWTAAELFVGLNGMLTQTPPSTGFMQSIARVESPDTIFIALSAIFER